MTPIILASASPRRRELFALLSVPFETVPAEVDEAVRPGETPVHTARRLSLAKAHAVAASYAQAWVVAADTLVALGGDILGKPANVADAAHMLRRMRGREHQVVSGLTVLHGTTGQSYVEVVETNVWMRGYSNEEIEAYVNSGDPMDKAGAYAIQHTGFQPVSRVRGCPLNVIGLPLCRVHTALVAMGYPMPPAVVEGCNPSRRCAIESLVLPQMAS